MLLLYLEDIGVTIVTTNFKTSIANVFRTIFEPIKMVLQNTSLPYSIGRNWSTYPSYPDEKPVNYMICERFKNV